MSNEWNIDDLYPLSPTQQGMLFHTIYATTPGVYVEQVVCTLRGSLDAAIFRRAWQNELARHPILRTAFVWEDVEEPVQVVNRFVELPWEELDWRHVAEDERLTQLYSWLARDREQGFDLASAPLLRLTLFRVADDLSILSWTFHHLLLDGWSMFQLLREVFSAYDMLRLGREAPLPLRPPYREYISWLSRQDQSMAETFWHQRLKGFEAPTSLRAERPEDVADPEAEIELVSDTLVPASTGTMPQAFWQQSGQPVRLRGTKLPRAMTDQLRLFARQRQLTLNTLVQGAWALLLSRYSGKQDVLFGATITGRPTDLPGAETMIGLFINTLPVRIAIPAQTSLENWLVELQMREVEARQYAYCPLVQVQGWSEITHEQPLFESIVVFESYPMPKAREGWEDGESGRQAIHLESMSILEQTNYPLVLIAVPWDEMELLLGYDVTRFSAGAIQRMLGHLHTILAGFLAHPDLSPVALPLLTEHEQQQLLAWNRQRSAVIESELPHHTTVVEQLQRRIAHAPDAVALVWRDEMLSYGELDRRSNQLARFLQRSHVGAEVRVAVCFDRSPDLLIALLGVLKAGGVYVPVEPGYPAERLAYVFDDAGVDVILTHTRFREQCSSSAHARLLCIDTCAHEIAQEPHSAPASTIFPQQAAYIIYTSGSTGFPKGVVVSHEALLQHNSATVQQYQLSSSDRVLQFAAAIFDVSLEEVLPTWLVGATVVLWPEPLPPSFIELARFIEEQRLSVLNLPSSYWHEWVAELLRTQTQLAHTLRLLIVGSERVLPSVLASWQKLVVEQRLAVSWCNAYGLTETTITALCTTPGASLERVQERLSVPLGQPLPGVRAYVLDTTMHPVPIGVTGEIYIGGAGLARGYQGRPDLTAERFVPDPLASQAGSRLYRTGDQGRFLSDGTLEFMGRLDTQVKVRGFRVEPEEIEGVVRRYPGVREALVLARTRGRQDETDLGGNETWLVAYVVTPRQTPAMRDRLQRYLEAQLPTYMVPSTLVLLETFPRTPGGKIDRQALMTRTTNSHRGMEDGGAPQTPIEELLIGIWSMVLRSEHIGRNAHFFKLGGHSLQATQVVARIRETLHVEIPVRAIYDAPTIAALGAYVEHLRQNDHKLQVPPAIIAVERHDALPLSFAQQRLWFLDRLEPGSPLYNMSGAIRLHGELDGDALQHSLATLVQRHESLRTTFFMREELPVQSIASKMSIPLSYIDLSGIASSEAREAALQTVLRAGIQQPFDLTHGPLLRVWLLRLATTEYLLLLSLHHIVADDWSIGIMIRELSICYSAYRREQMPELSELPLQYADYAVWQRQWLQGTKLEDLLAYWRAQLVDAPTLLTLPTDYPRPAEASLRGASHTFTCPASLQQELRLLSQRRGVTLFMTLLAAFQTLLLRYGGQEDSVIGTPIAGRLQSATEGMIGLFLNTLVLRTNLAGDPAFDELLERVREVCLGAYEHQELPFEKLVDELQPARSLSYTPLFQVLFVLQNVPQEQLALPGLTLQPVLLERTTAKFDLALTLEESEAGLVGILEYDTALFAASTIVRLGTHYQQLLRAIVTDDQCRLSALPLLSESEIAQQLTTWNATRRVWHVEEEVMPLFFQRQVAKTPDAIALLFEDEQVTYRVLNERANRVAHFLQTAGVGPDVPVGLWMERSVELVIGLLGILKAGGAYLSLDPAYPPQRIAFMLADSNVPVLLTHRDLQQRLPPCQARIINIDADWPLIEQAAIWNPVSHISVDHLAYITYTSGSTGHPKGTLVPHAGLVNLASAQIEAFQVTPADRVLQFASWSFDAAIFELLMALLAGATLCLEHQDHLLPGPGLLKLLSERAITAVTLPPSALLVLPHVSTGDLPALRTLIVAGEACPREVVVRWAKHCQVWNAYGPSEATVCATMERCTIEDAKPPIGRPLANVQVYILDRWMQPVPLGGTGELYIGGPGLARGYLHSPELTARHFVPHPFSDTAGARLYRTGDLARFLSDGRIEFLGRVDRQVKLRGYRIEVEEIEAVLLRSPGVREAVVSLRQDRPGEARLIAYIVAQPDQEVTSLALRHFLHERLPDYMLPAAFVLLPALPLTPNGKLDRSRLPAPDWSQRPGLQGALPSTPLERLLATLWADVLGLEQVGVQENFFELGGDSIQVIQVCARAQQHGLLLLPRQLFQHQTVALLAPHVQEVPASASVVDEAAGNASELDSVLEDAYPLSPMQQGMLFQTLRDPLAGIYCQQLVITVRTPLQREAFKRAWHMIVERHSILRTAFRWEGQDEPSQLVYRDVEIPWEEQDWCGIDEQEQHTRLQALLEKDAREGFALDHAPLMRVRLLHLAIDRWYVLWSHHHLLLDGWSLSLVLEEVATCYEALCQGQTPMLVPSQPFRRYISWLQQQDRAAAEAFWRGYLAGFYEPTPLPVRDYAGRVPSRLAGGYQELEMRIAQETYEHIQTFARQHRLTLNTLVEGAWALLLSRNSGARDVLFGSTVSTRPTTLSGIASMVGLFINTLPVRVSIDADMELLSWLGQLQARQVEARQYDYCSLAHLQTWSEVPRGSALFASLLAFENNPFVKRSADRLELAIEPAEAQWGAYPLTLSIRPGEELLLRIGYERTRCDDETIVCMLEQFAMMLTRMVAEPGQRLKQVMALSQAEREQVLFQWNATDTAYPDQACIQQLFAAQAQSTPDALAVVYEDQQINYRALDGYANTVARVLREEGVGAEVLVGVYMERCVEMIVVLLGILKAGAAYVPMDLSFPAERLSYIQRDTCMPLVITQQRLVQRLPASPARIFCVDNGEMRAYDASSRVLLTEDIHEQSDRRRSWPENLAYVMYTSGSTGVPKGVAVTHRNVVRLVKETGYAHFSADEVFLQFAPIAFDASTLEIWGSLLHGARLIVFPAFAPSLEELAQALERYQVTTLWLTAGLFHQMVEAHSGTLRRIRQLLAGGDTLAVPQVLQLLQAGGSVINGYGPTENTTFTCCFPTTHSDQIGSSVPIGRPIANTQVYLLTDDLEPVPVGSQGELYIGGAGLGRGYLQQPDLTAERFIPHPFSSLPGARLYRTGDLARYRPDGNLEFLGRRDTQVKIRGYRVEPGEIEGVLRQQPGVQEAVVVVREYPPGNRQLLAYLVPEASAGSSSTAIPILDLMLLRRTLQNRLPEYMLPAVLTVIEALPLTANGKVDRRALPAPEVSQGAGEQNSYVAARNTLEETLETIWAEVLQQERVSIDDDFFDLGGHSLLVTQIISRIRSALHIQLPLRTLFEAPTIARLAEVIMVQTMEEIDDEELARLLAE